MQLPEYGMIPHRRDRYTARRAETPGDLRACQSLRARAFGLSADFEEDRFDAACTHILIEETSTGRLVCCYRMLTLTAQDIQGCYSAQFYELSALQAYEGPMVELGRFCMDPQCTDPDILRLAWAVMTEFVDAHNVQLLFGCSSFSGIETAHYLDAFAMLKARHLAPKRWLPRIKAPDVFRFAARLRRRPDLTKAMRVMPPLLRTYLAMGGWVSDHAVVDRQMNTLHVFTGVEIAAIPVARQRLLRALVA